MAFSVTTITIGIELTLVSREKLRSKRWNRKVPISSLIVGTHIVVGVPNTNRRMSINSPQTGRASSVWEEQAESVQWIGLFLDLLSRPHRVDRIHRTDEDFSVAMLAGFCAGLNSGDG